MCLIFIYSFSHVGITGNYVSELNYSVQTSLLKQQNRSGPDDARFEVSFR
jgi:hypothetical protein